MEFSLPDTVQLTWEPLAATVMLPGAVRVAEAVPAEVMLVRL